MTQAPHQGEGDPRAQGHDRSARLRALVQRVMEDVAERHRRDRPALRPEDLWPAPPTRRRRGRQTS